MNTALRTALELFSPAGTRGRLSILIFHRVLRAPDPLFPEETHVARFDGTCRWITELFNVLPLTEAIDRLDAGSLPARAACITFDDGYADNWTEAAPILARHRLPATFFIATGFLDGGRMWNDTLIEAVRRTEQIDLDLGDIGVPGLARLDLRGLAQRRRSIDAAIGAIKHLSPDRRQSVVDAIAARAKVELPHDLMLRSEQVLAMRRSGLSIGAHTVSHPIIAKLSASEQRREIDASRQALQSILGEPVTVFAYPNGKPGQDYNDESTRIVRELGFRCALSTAWGAASDSSDRFQLPRFTPWDNTPTRFALRMVGNLLRP